jgi:hypothetical protein
MEVANAVSYLLRSVRRGLHVLPWLPCFAAVLAISISATEACFVLKNQFPRARSSLLHVNAIVTASVSCASLAAVARRAARCGSAGEKRQHRTAVIWIANALLTNMTFGILNLFGLIFLQRRTPERNMLKQLGFLNLSAKGTLNCCAIFYSSRYSNEAVTDVARLKNPDPHSFHVDVSGRIDVIPLV